MLSFCISLKLISFQDFFFMPHRERKSFFALFSFHTISGEDIWAVRVSKIITNWLQGSHSFCELLQSPENKISTICKFKSKWDFYLFVNFVKLFTKFSEEKGKLFFDLKKIILCFMRHLKERIYEERRFYFLYLSGKESIKNETRAKRFFVFEMDEKKFNTFIYLCRWKENSQSLGRILSSGRRNFVKSNVWMEKIQKNDFDLFIFDVCGLFTKQISFQTNYFCCHDNNLLQIPRETFHA